MSFASATLEFSTTFFIWAVLLGMLSAVSLPLGSALGLMWRPPRRVVGLLTAFGAGALVAALAVELVAPTTAAVTQSAPEHRGEAAGHLISMIVGAVVGGLLFVLLDQLVNARGGFLRKTATTIAFLAKRRRERSRQVIQQLAENELLRDLSPADVAPIAEAVRPVSFDDGEVLFHEGDPGDRVYFLEEGKVELDHGGQVIKVADAGDTVGEMALVTGAPRTATGTARGTVDALFLGRATFDEIRRSLPRLHEAATRLVENRIGEIADIKEKEATAASAWAKRAMRALRRNALLPTPAELQRARQKQGTGAPLAIWLGILLDGLPESFVIGASLLGILAGLMHAGQIESASFFSVIPYTLILGLFLANFPEAMSSSIGMRLQGWGRGRIFFLWFSLMLITGAGAGLGYALGNAAPHGVVILIEGLAAGAMLTMISSTMIPEAVHLGGPTITGLGSLLGFLSAIAFKLAE